MLADLSSYDPNQQGYAQYSTYVSSMVTLNDKVCVHARGREGDRAATCSGAERGGAWSPVGLSSPLHLDSPHTASPPSPPHPPTLPSPRLPPLQIYMGLATNVVPVDSTVNAVNQPPTNTRQYPYKLYEYSPSTGALVPVPGVDPTCGTPGWSPFPPTSTSSFVPRAANNIKYAPYEVYDLFIHVGA
jgi:hypothetical protein